MDTNRIIEKVEIVTFQSIVKRYKSAIFISSHALDHLSLAQRKVFKEEDLERPILQEQPNFVGLQKNGRYASYYKRDKYFLKIILEVKETKIDIITFMNVENIPNLGELENGK